MTRRPRARPAAAAPGVTSRQRVVDHGEVFTPPGLVRAMLDLVAHECDRVDARFLEPACGDGNFLAEVLRRRLAAVTARHGRSQLGWEPNALLGLACLYGVELLHDNVQRCRDRLAETFADAYRASFGDHCRPACVAAARFVAGQNVLFGDALTMAERDHDARPLVFTEWSLLPLGLFKRRRFEYRQLAPPTRADGGGLFAGTAPAPRASDDGRTVFLPTPVGDLPPIHYLSLAAQGSAAR